MLLQSVGKLSAAEPHEPGGGGQDAVVLMQRFIDQARLKAVDGKPLVQLAKGVQQCRAGRCGGELRPAI